MYTPPFRRRASLSYTEAALTALVLATPVMMAIAPQTAAAQGTISITSAGGSAATCSGYTDCTSSLLSGFGNYVSAADGKDYLTGNSGFTIMPGGSAAAANGTHVSGNTVTIDGYNFATSNAGITYSVVGGGFNSAGGTAGVTDNKVIVQGNANITGKVVGGINGISGSVTNNIVILEGGTVGDDVIGGVGAGSGVSSISGNSAVIMVSGGGSAVVSGSVVGGWSADTSGNGSGYTNNANVDNNTVQIVGGGITIHGDAKGGISQRGNATSNAVSISGTNASSVITIKGSVVGGFVQNQASSGGVGSATSNTVNIDGYVVVSGGAGGDDGVVGGETNTSGGPVTGNQVTITGGSAGVPVIYGAIVGGQATVNSAVENRVTITNTNSGTALTLRNNVIGGNVKTSGGAEGNTVTITGNVTQQGAYSIYGGLANSGAATSNHVSLGGVTQTTSGSVYGGYVGTGASNATGNTVTIDGGTYGKVVGGQAYGGSAIDNKVTIGGGASAGTVYGGYVASGAAGEAKSNVVTINDGTYGTVVGGHANSGSAIGNQVIINGGTFGTVIGGETTSGGSAVGNIVTLAGAAGITNLYAGKTTSGGIVLTDNVLNKDSEAARVTSAGGFATVNFDYVDDGYANIENLDTGASSVTLNIGDGDRTVIFAATTPATSTFNSATSKWENVSGTNEQKIIGSGGIVKTGDGTLVLAGGNTYTGSTVISGGNLTVTGTLGAGLGAGKTNVHSGNITIESDTSLAFNQSVNQTLTGTIGNNGSLEFNQFTGSASQVVSGVISGGGELIKGGEGKLILAGGNTYTGDTTITGGTLEVTGTLGTGNSYGGLIDNDGTLLFGNADSGVNQTLSGEISGGGKLIKTGLSKLTLAEANTYTGETVVSAGTLVLAAEDAIETSSKVSLNGEKKSGGDVIAKLVIGADNLIYGLSGNEYSEITLNNGDEGHTLSVYIAADQVSTFNGKIINAGILAKQGEGALVLGGDLSGLGTYNVTAGTALLQGENVNGIHNAGKFGTDTHAGQGGITVSPGATLGAEGSVEVGRKVEVKEGATLAIETVDPKKATGKDDGAIFTEDVKLDGDMVFYGDASWATGSNPAAQFRKDLAVGKDTSINPYFTKAPEDPEGLFGSYEQYKDVYHEVFEKVGSIPMQGGFLTVLELTEIDGKLVSVHKATEQAKALSEGFLGGVALVTQGGDLVTDQGMSNAVSSARSGVGAGFAALGGGSVKYKSGSHVDVSGVSLVAGIAANVGSGVTVGAFAEYGDGNYDSYNNFSTGKVKGSGDTDYVGAGVLGRIDLPKTANGQPYLEGTVRFGQVKSDYKTSDLYNPSLGQRVVKYDLKSSYYGASFGGGHTWNLSGDNTIDLYGRYVWTRQAADKARLFTSEEIKFSAVDSQRVRIGTRYSAAWDRSNRFYVGAAWEHEFDGDANAKVGGGKVDAPSLKGNTGIAEFGLVLTPSDNKNLTVDLGIQAYGGKHKGATGTAQLKFVF